MDKELGNQLKDIVLEPNPYLALVGWAIIGILAVSVLIGFRLFTIAIVAAVLFGIMAAGLWWSGHHLQRSVSQIRVHENRMMFQIGMKKHTVLWNEIEAIQTSEFTDHVKEYVDDTTPFIVPLPGFIIFGIHRQSGWRSSSSAHANYVFHTSDGQTYTIRSSNPRQFALMPYIRTNVLTRIIPATIQRFKDGDAISLVKGVAYSQQGIQGEFARKGRRSTRQIPINVEWDQIERIYYLGNSIRLNAKNQEPIILPFSEIINRGAFVAVLKALNEEGRVPRVES